MAKYGRGLNREIASEVNIGKIVETFSITDVRSMIQRKGWTPEPTENYINCCLANGSSDTHSLTYKKYFRSIGNGFYPLRDEFKRGDEGT